MKTDKNIFYSNIAPFRPVAESARMINNTSLAVVLVAVIAVSFIRNEFVVFNCMIAVGWPLLLERVIVFCRGAGQKGSTSHSVLLGVIVFALLPEQINVYVLCFTITLAVLLKHFQGGFGNYLCHPSFAAICILELLQPGAKAYFELSNVNGSGNLALNYNFFNSGQLTDGLSNMADVLASRMPEMADCLLGRTDGPLALNPFIYVLAGVYFIYRGYFNWRVPVLFLASITIAVLVLPVSADANYYSIFRAQLLPEVMITYVFYQISAGFIVFVAAVTWLDTTSRPINISGQLVLAVLAGCLLIALRLYTTFQYPELFAMVISGLLVPIIDSLTRRPRADYSRSCR